jgi:hypothetical protein
MSPTEVFETSVTSTPWIEVVRKGKAKRKPEKTLPNDRSLMEH